MMSSLPDLITRLEAATSGDRELDALIAAELRILSPAAEKERWAREWAGPFEAHGDLVFLMHSNGERGLNYRPDHYTTSCDAALKLLERVLPEAAIRIDIDEHGCSARVEYSVGTGWCFEEEAVHPALALCIAMLRALSSHPSDEVGAIATASCQARDEQGLPSQDQTP